MRGAATTLAVKVSWLVSWCFEPSQPQRITSGLIAVKGKIMMMMMIFVQLIIDMEGQESPNLLRLTLF